jgi:uncharacterized surface protein with fasciclin (FAS1) repeats
MLKRIFGAVAAMAIVGTAVAPVRADEHKDIVDTAAAAGQFKTLLTAAKEAGLVDALKGKGPLTVFAPTDEAFAKIPEDTLKAVLADKEKLKKILLAHVVSGKAVKAADAVKLNGEKVNGFEIKAEGGKVMIGKANVVKADVTASNGVIHVIDTVLIPE